MNMLMNILSRRATGGGSLPPPPPAPASPLLDVVELPSGTGEDCSICLSPLLENCVRTGCGHDFHAECLEQHFVAARTPGRRACCPLCRGVLHAPLPVEARACSGRAIEVRSGSYVHLKER